MINPEILPCPMCGSSAKLDASGVSECYGKDWQTVYIECSKENNMHCDMELSLHGDFWYIRNSEQVLVNAWNALDRHHKV